MFNDGLPVEQGAEFDNVEEDGHLRSRLIFEVGQLRETILPLSLTRVWCICVLSVNPVQFSADVDNYSDMYHRSLSRGYIIVEILWPTIHYNDSMQE